MAGQKNETLNAFTQRLQSTVFRRSFAANPLGALAASGIDSSKIPAPMLDALSELSYAELTTLANVQKHVAPLAADGTGCNFF
jgi:asparagine synthetase B (glutamine-hydrolysing)